MQQLLIILFSLLSLKSFGQKDTVKVIMLISSPVSVVYGWDIRELKNTIQKDSPVVFCCTDYWQHTEYLSEAKRPLCATKSGCKIIVWAVKDSLWVRNELVKK